MKDQSSDKLFAYAVRALAARAYSEATFRRKLVQRAGVDEADAVIQRIKTAGYLDDQAYAEGYARLYSGKWGAGKIRRSLREKGVSGQIIDRVLAKLEPESDPVEVVQTLLERYQSRHKGDKAKAIRFLVGRGYSFAEALAGWSGYEKSKSE